RQWQCLERRQVVEAFETQVSHHNLTAAFLKLALVADAERLSQLGDGRSCGWSRVRRDRYGGIGRRRGLFLIGRFRAAANDEQEPEDERGSPGHAGEWLEHAAGIAHQPLDCTTAPASGYSATGFQCPHIEPWPAAFSVICRSESPS